MPSQKTSLLIEGKLSDVDLTLLAFQPTQIDDKVAVLGNRIEVLDDLLRTGDYQDRNPNDVPTLILSYNRGWNPDRINVLI